RTEQVRSRARGHRDGECDGGLGDHVVDGHRARGLRRGSRRLAPRGTVLLPGLAVVEVRVPAGGRQVSERRVARSAQLILLGVLAPSTGITNGAPAQFLLW